MEQLDRSGEAVQEKRHQDRMLRSIRTAGANGVGLRDLYRNLNFSAKQARQIAGNLVKAGLIEERRLNRAEWFVAVEHVGEQPYSTDTTDTPTTDDKVSVLSVVGTVISIPTSEETEETVNHTQRIAHVARQRRVLTKALVREAVERYFEALVEDIASGEWVDLPGIGKIQVIQEEASGT